ncbi:MAG: hypothetical protein ABIR24_07825 [Verrucomicrobiota bacterium]
MSTKQICVLANSVKNKNRCVAGFEISKTSDGQIAWGSWIRPVSPHDNGAVNFNERRLLNRGGNQEPQILDVIEISLKQHEADPVQPENWLIDSSKSWKWIGTIALKDILAREERPPDLWLEERRKPERISPNYLQREKNLQSLYLIRPQKIHLEIHTEYNREEGRNKRVRRVLFSYNWFNYDLPLTDADIEQRYFPDFPNEKEGVREIELESKNNCLLCLSYTPLFNGFHYKVVATILELPE